MRGCCVFGLGWSAERDTSPQPPIHSFVCSWPVARSHVGDRMATTFTRSTGDIFRPYGRDEVRWYPMAASQSFKMGEPVILDSASTENRIKVSADNPTANIVGVAAANASDCANSDGTTTAAMCPVWIAKPHLSFRIQTFNTDAIDYTDIGTARALQVHATLANTWVVDTSDAGNDSVVIERYLEGVEGDFAGIAQVHFQPAATIWGVGA